MKDEELIDAWNMSWNLKQMVRHFVPKGYTKQYIYLFYRNAVDRYGYLGSIPKPKTKSWSIKPSRAEIISKYSVSTGMFGNYAEWLGFSVNHFLRLHGYKEI